MRLCVFALVNGLVDWVSSSPSPSPRISTHTCVGKIQAFRHAVAFHSKLLAYEQVRHGTTIIMAYSLHMQ